jgi:hypothetical protein
VLVGSWTQSDYQKDVHLADTEVGTRNNLGTVRMTGGGQRWEIASDGAATTTYRGVTYAGKAADGRLVEAVFDGQQRYRLSTADGKISYAGVDSTVSVAILVGGARKGTIKLEPNLDPLSYSCADGNWRTFTGNSDFSTYRRG